MLERFGQEFQAFDTRPAAANGDVDRAVLGHQLVGGHTGVSHEDEAGFRVQAHEIVQQERFAVSGGVLPECIVDGVVEKQGAQLLELGLA
jgi:hypothetical protein